VEIPPPSLGSHVTVAQPQVSVFAAEKVADRLEELPLRHDDETLNRTAIMADELPGPLAPATHRS